MPKYLYNGIELPALPDWDKKIHPYALITIGDLTKRAYLYILSAVEFATNDNSVWSVTIPIGTPRAIAEKDATSWGAFKEVTDASAPFIENIDWANFDVLNEDGSVYLPASDPVPVTPHDPTVLFMGWLAGKRMAAMRGKDVPDEPSVTILTKPFDGEITTGEDGTGAAYWDGCMPAGTEFIVNVNGTSLSGIVDESGQYYSDNINMDDGSVDYTKYPAGVALMLGMIMVIGEINTTYTVSVSVTKYPETVWCYNGVWLYAFDWDKEQYPYATLMAYGTGIGPSYRMYLAKYTLDRDRELYVHNEGDGTWFLQSAEGWGSANTATGGNKSVSEYTALWTNYDMLYEDGTTYLAASEPVAVYE